MTAYRQWDLILVNFPFTDLSSSKKRPSLVISPDVYNQEEDLVILFVTSNLKGKQRYGDYHFQEWKKVGLPKPSMVKMKFATISRNIVYKKIGTLQKKDVIQVKKNLKDFFFDFKK